VLAFFEAHGATPLPPYITRPADNPIARYQSIFAVPGARTHRQPAFRHTWRRIAWVARSQVTLHVGAGTFQPLRVENIAEHVMHAERFEVSAQLVQDVATCRAAGGRVVAVGTTVARALESAAAGGRLAEGRGDTRLFITPGYAFRVVDALLTNFHLPESTLLMLVSAFAGREAVLSAYAHAVAQRYRFFSYGDAMWVTPKGNVHA
jgi:S-adenosylmethionine:tRNA ribosyltransferase-isomerase